MVFLFASACFPSGDPESLTLTNSQALANFEAALERDGDAAHAMIELSYTSGDQSGRLGTIEAWYDADRRLGRQEWVKDPSFGADVPEWENGIIAAHGIYLDTGSSTRTISPLDGGPAELLQECRGPTATILLTITSAFGCFGDWGAATIPPETTEYEGVPAIRIAGTAGPEIAPADRAETTAALYLDADTDLPVAAEITIDVLDSSIRDGAFLITYDVDFVALDSLPVDFFDLSEVGYFEPTEFFDRVEDDLPIYWLGPEVQLASGTTYFLDDVTGDEEPGWSARLWYRSADAPPIYINIFRPPEWDDFLPSKLGQNWWTASCVTAMSVAVRDREATIYSGYADYECRDGDPFDGFMAVVTFPDVVVTINAPVCYTCGPGRADAALLREVIEAMGRRPPER